MFDKSTIESSKCQSCGSESKGKKFCSNKCKIYWHNHNRILTANVKFNCEMCGKFKETWIAPSRISAIGMPRFCSRVCAGKDRTGKNNPNWKGEVATDKDGYVYIYIPEHPNANHAGRVFRHRLVMEAAIGRYLNPEEVVHHVNDIPGDDRIENLRLYSSNADHKREDYKFREIDSSGRFLPKKGK